jgi:cytochrome c553
MGKHVASTFGRALTALLVLAAASPFLQAAETTPEGVEFFEKKVRPVLVEHCFKCHGDKKKGRLRLDSRAGMLKGGDSGPALTPGQPDQSLFVKAVRYTDPVLRMPPKSKLPDAHIADLAAWVKMGAPWPEGGAASGAARVETFDLKERSKHWSLQPVKPYAPPAVRRRDWPTSPVDWFVLAALEAKGLAPAQPADKRTLLRRVTYDLIGLPPTPAEIDAFLADASPDAFAKVVDRLLASPHYGERWGRHWLDLVRFAETAGHEFDFELPEAFAYRDYVIRAFNADVPYDRLVIEHVAGDLLAEPRRHPIERFNESVLGTGFWFLGEAKHSPVDVKADEADRLDNQIDVFAKAFLGLTVSCARCHDHKFDAITTKDYYALAGYLESSRFQRAFLDDSGPRRDAIRKMQDLRRQGRDLAVAITAKALHERAADLSKSLLSARPAPAPEKGRRKTEASPERHPLYPLLELAGKEALTPEQFAAKRRDLVERLRARSARAADGASRSTVFEDFKKGNYQDWFVSGEAFGDGPSRGPEVLLRPDPARPVRRVVGPGVTHSGLVSDQLKGVLRSRTFVIEKKKILYHAAGRGAQVNLIIDNFQQIRAPIYGGLTFPIDGDRPAWHAQDVGMWVGQRAYIEIIDDGPGYAAVDRILFADDRPPAEPVNPLLIRMLDNPNLTTPEALARKYQELLTEIMDQWQSGRLHTAQDAADRLEILNWVLEDDRFAAPDGEAGADGKQLAALLERHGQLEAGLPAPRRGMAMQDGTGWDERVYIRGNHNNLGEAVPRRFLEALAGPAQPAPARGSGRLELARRLVDPDNPLLARVLVNRLWLHHFGEGIVRSPDNFGVLGERPSHPELLDYLAAELIRQGWSIKQMHRLMVLSSAYRMSSRPEAGAEEADPQNRLWHRMPIRRLEAECIRDALLAVSGRLDRTMYGPGVPPHLTPHMAGRGRPTFSGPLDGNGRRSVYLNVRRNFLTPMFLAFDYPIPFTTMGRRSVSNVPAQALTLMNNPLVVQQAERWARRALAEPARSPAERVTGLYVTAFGRPPAEDELRDALAFLEEQGKGYGRAEDPRAWADLCHVLINVKEFIFIR